MSPSPPRAPFAHLYLCFLPLIAGGLAAPRPLRANPAHLAIGGVVFTLAALAFARALRHAHAPRSPLAALLLTAPFAVIGLLWVGLGTPWDATPPENLMRYCVLLFCSVSVTAGLVIASLAATDAGAPAAARLAAVLGLLAGAAFTIWNCDQIDLWSARDRQSSPLPPGGSDTLLFAACLLTYFAAAALAIAFRRLQWLGRAPAAALAIAALVAAAFLCARGLSFPDPTRSDTPWYTQPGFIAGIPAIPWIIPHLLGAALLLRLPTPRPRAEGPA